MSSNGRSVVESLSNRSRVVVVSTALRLSECCVVDGGVVVAAGKGDYGDIMLARVDSADSAAGQQRQQQQQQSLVVVKSLLSSGAHHRRAFEHEAEMFSRARHFTAADCHIVTLLGVCCSLQPPLIITEYCELVRMMQLIISSWSFHSAKFFETYSLSAPVA